MVVLLWTAILSVLVLIAALICERVCEARDRRRYPAPGTMVDIGGRRLHLNCQGDATGPTVVIEQGAASPASVWWPVQATIAKFARVCTYDRAGFLWSDPAPTARTLDDRVADLHALLQRGAVPAPYILVGHSLGGLLLRRFARAYPDLVAGLVLVDSPDEAVVFRDSLQPYYSQGLRMQQVLGVLARVGLIRLLGRRVPMLMLPDDPAGYSLCARPQHNAAAADDMRALLNAPAGIRQPELAGALGERPLLVIAHGIPFPPMAAAMEEGWGASQERLARLSTDSELVIAHKSGHLVHLDEPELVVESVRRVHAAAREGTRLTAPLTLSAFGTPSRAET